MAPRTNIRLSTVEEAASGSEDDLATAYTSGTTSRARTTGTKPSRSKTSSRPENATTTTTKTANKRKAPPPEPNRVALKDKTNLQERNEMDEFDGDGDVLEPSKAKRVKTGKAAPAKKASAKVGRGRPKKVQEDEQPVVIPESQPEPEDDVSQSIEVDAEQLDGHIARSPPQPQRAAQRARSTSVQPLQPRPSARSTSVQPLQPRLSARGGSVQPGYPPLRERSGSISDAMRGRRAGDSELRRQLEEMTVKCEDLNAKYQELEEIGRSEAESNFQKLKRASDQKAQHASELITSLKKEIVELRKAAIPPKVDTGEIKSLQEQVSVLTSKNAEISEKHEQTQSVFQVMQNEVKSLEAKLIAARQQLSNNAAQEASKKDLNRTIGSNASEGLNELKMKESLYSDLTGLIIRSVKRKDGEDEYDCIQTGRNGTLHFHLAVANDASYMNPQTPSGLSWEDAEFAYDPFLDERHDQALIDNLPEYLTDGICFPRHDAVKFYSKILESMTKKIVVED